MASRASIMAAAKARTGMFAPKGGVTRDAVTSRAATGVVRGPTTAQVALKKERLKRLKAYAKGETYTAPTRTSAAPTSVTQASILAKVKARKAAMRGVFSRR